MFEVSQDSVLMIFRSPAAALCCAKLGLSACLLCPEFVNIPEIPFSNAFSSEFSAPPVFIASADVEYLQISGFLVVFVENAGLYKVIPFYLEAKDSCPTYHFVLYFQSKTKNL